jgi:hypothetical protein
MEREGHFVPVNTALIIHPSFLPMHMLHNLVPMRVHVPTIAHFGNSLRKSFCLSGARGIFTSRTLTNTIAYMQCILGTGFVIRTAVKDDEHFWMWSKFRDPMNPFKYMRDLDNMLTNVFNDPIGVLSWPTTRTNGCERHKVVVMLAIF